MNLVALQTKTKENFQENLEHLKELITACEPNSFILAPELCLTGFCYDRMQEASEFAIKAKEELLKLSLSQTIVTSFIEQKDDSFLNTLYIFSEGKILHTQSKHRLFPLGNEPEYFVSGEIEKMKVLDIRGFKVAVLICFEIRFPEYWLNVRGADLILNPAMWGLKRKNHYETMTKALAVANQCYVLASNSADENMAKGSGIITPWGEEIRDDNSERVSHTLKPEEIKNIRKYINIGLE